MQYYRKDVYDAHGLEPAVTWDDLIHVSQTLTGDGHYGLVVPGQGDPAQHHFSDLLWQAGGKWVDENDEPSFNAAARVEALTFYRDLIEKYKVTPPTRSARNGTRIRPSSSGAVFDTFDSPDAYATLSNRRRQGGRKMVDRALLRNKQANSCAISHAMALNSVSKKKDAAVELIKYGSARRADAPGSRTSPIFRAGSRSPSRS